MKKAFALALVMITVFLLNACSPQKNEAESALPVRGTSDTAAETKEGYSKPMEYDFGQFSNVNITGIDISSLDEEESAILYSANVELTNAEFTALEDALNSLKVYGHRGLGGF